MQGLSMQAPVAMGPVATPKGPATGAAKLGALAGPGLAASALVLSPAFAEASAQAWPALQAAGQQVTTPFQAARQVARPAASVAIAQVAEGATGGLWARVQSTAKAWGARLNNWWFRLTHPATPLAQPAPNLPPMPANLRLPQAPGGPEAPSQIVAEQPYSLDPDSAAQAELRQERSRQKAREADGAGKVLGGRHSRDTRRVREIAAWAPSEKLIPAQGLVAGAQGYAGPALRNPNDPSGRFDPYALQPHWVFDAKEDSLPVRPDFDGQGGVANDLGAYQHGQIGGKQPLAGAFSVTQRGEYTVLTYSLNYVDNKFTNYHEGDSSTASIYLKPKADGKLAPAYLYTSFHYNARMVPWQDVKLDPQGHPIIRVERGSHALYPYRKDEAITADGLHVQGDGQATWKGQPLPHRMSWFGLQEGLANTQFLDPKPPANQSIWKRLLDGYPERRVPFHPTLFDRG